MSFLTTSEDFPPCPKLIRYYKAYCSFPSCNDICYTENSDRTGGFCFKHQELKEHIDESEKNQLIKNSTVKDELSIKDLQMLCGNDTIHANPVNTSYANYLSPPKRPSPINFKFMYLGNYYE